MMRIMNPLPSDVASNTWIGGEPTWPKNADWPDANGQPLHFVVQIALRDFGSDGSPLPATGCLFFFLDDMYHPKSVVVKYLEEESVETTPRKSSNTFLDQRFYQPGIPDDSLVNEDPMWAIFQSIFLLDIADDWVKDNLLWQYQKDLQLDDQVQRDLVCLLKISSKHLSQHGEDFGELMSIYWVISLDDLKEMNFEHVIYYADIS